MVCTSLLQHLGERTMWPPFLDPTPVEAIHRETTARLPPISNNKYVNIDI